jgi:hypothetical protein
MVTREDLKRIGIVEQQFKDKKLYQKIFFGVLLIVLMVAIIFTFKKKRKNHK